MISEKIKLVRKSKRLTQKAFAEALSTSSSYICEVEQGKTMPGSTFLIALKREFAVDLNWLVSESDVGPEWDVSPKDRVSGLIMSKLAEMPEQRKLEVLTYAEERLKLAQLEAEPGGVRRRRR